MSAIIFSHIKCPLHRYTFSIKPLRIWVERQCEGKVLNLFSGITRLQVNEIRNDLDPDAIADYHLDALEFLHQWRGNRFDTVLLDPPYSYRKSMELYKGFRCSPFRQVKDAIPPHLNSGGKVITFGYHSVVMGKSRGFHPEHIGIISHGGAIHDTVVAVERYHPMHTNTIDHGKQRISKP